MGEHMQNVHLSMKLLDLMKRTGYPILQHNGQRKTGPPPDWTGPPPPKGCEVFIGKLPRDVYEDTLMPLFSRVGKIYTLRLMMDFSGFNRGYAFVVYATRAEAAAAVKQLDNYEIKPRHRIGVVKSVDNCRLFIGNIPRDKTKDELYQELCKYVTDIVDVIMYTNSFDRRMNRGFAFVEFTCHTAAAMARRELVPGCVKLWGQEVLVDWAEPEPDIDDEEMKKVKVLYVRNFAIWTTADVIKKVFEDAINDKVEHVKKIYDYAFIHFHERKHAELAMEKLQNADIDGSNVIICWARPVDRDLYRIQKLSRGNAKFNNIKFDLAQTLMLYKQHLDKKEYAHSSPKDEGIGSAYAGNSPSISPMDTKPAQAFSTSPPSSYTFAPAKLEAMCKRYAWAAPVYSFQKNVDPTGVELWVCAVELPQVGVPLFAVPRRIGPLIGKTCYSLPQANIEAAEIVLQTLKMLYQQVQQSPPAAAAPAYTPLPAARSVQNFMRLPCDYPQLYPQMSPVVPITMPPAWQLY